MATLRLDIDTSRLVRGAGSAENALEDVAIQARATAEATDNIGISAPVAARGMGALSGNSRGLAQQLSQVVDMGLATGQWAKAFFIQASDIAMLFGGPWMIAIGSAIGVLGTLGVSFLTAGDNGKSLEEQIDDLTDAMSDYRDLVEGATASTEELTERFGDQADQAREVYRILAENKRLQLEQQAQGLVAGVTDPFGLGGTLAGLQTGQIAEQFGVDRPFLVFSEDARDARDEFDQLAQAAIDAQNRMANAQGLEQQLEAAQDVLTTYAALADLDDQRTQSEREYIDAVGETILQLQELRQLDEELAAELSQGGESMGRDIVEGVAIGIEAATPEAVASARSMADQVAQAARDALEIRSPSRVMIEVGQNIAEGVAIGIGSGEGGAVDAMIGLAGKISGSMENAFMSMIDGTMSAKDAFRSMARDIIAELYRVLVVQQLVGQFDAASGQGSGLMGLFGGLFGMRAEGGNVQAGEAYLVGERGPEVFRPAASGRIEQGSQGGVVVHQTFTFQANGDASVKQIIRQSMPEIAEASKAAVMDARQRGGSFAGVFR